MREELGNILYPLAFSKSFDGFAYRFTLPNPIYYSLFRTQGILRSHKLRKYAIAKRSATRGAKYHSSADRKY